jgi:hypothetical protein
MPQQYFSSGQRGSTRVLADNPQRVRARKLEREVQVRFTSTACLVQTPEGTDATLTGIAGENWRVSRARFAERDKPVPPTQVGEPGSYRSLPNRVEALLMNSAFEVLLADGLSQLRGRSGDWLVDYGDGSLGIVSPAIFATTYEIVA